MSDCVDRVFTLVCFKLHNVHCHPQRLVVCFLRTEEQKYRSTEVQKYRSTEEQKYRSTEVQKYRSTEVQKYRRTEVQKYRSTEEQKNRRTEVQKYRRTEEQKYRSTEVYVVVHTCVCKQCESPFFCNFKIDVIKNTENNPNIHVVLGAYWHHFTFQLNPPQKKHAFKLPQDQTHSVSFMKSCFPIQWGFRALSVFEGNGDHCLDTES